MNSVFIIYRTRFIYWEHSPEEPWTQGIVCGCVWAEDEAWDLGKEAQTKGYHISWAEVILAFPSIPQTLHNQCSFPANSLWSRMISMLKNSAISSL